MSSAIARCSRASACRRKEPLRRTRNVPPDRAALRRELEALSAAHARRRLCTISAFPEPGNPTRVLLDGRALVNFSSNDYLGLSHHPELVAALSAGAREFGVGAGAAHLISGHSALHQALEQELATFVGRERALLFSSGYMANLGVIAAFAGRHDLVLADSLNHASLIDGARQSGARLRRYAHASAADAARWLVGTHGALLVTDGVFSMDGDVAPVAALAELAARHEAWLMVDDAHGLGVLGTHGGGVLEQAGLGARAVPLLVGTLGKAFGSFGAFVAGDADLIELLLQRARTYIYTTAPPPAVAAAPRAALQLAQREPWRRERVLALTARWREGAAALGLPLSTSPTPIQPLIVGSAASALRLSEALAAAGFWVSAIRPPTVPQGGARLRVTLSAAHAEGDVDALLEALGAAWRSLETP
jgi:8-amino-7-oxononanoate synthase